MSRLRTRLPDFTNIAARSRATLNLPRNTTYDEILFRLSGTLPTPNTDNLTLKDYVKAIYVKANGKTFQEYVGAGLKKIDLYNKRKGRFDQTSKNVTTLYFRQPEMVSIDDERLFSFGTFDLTSATIEFELADTIPVDFFIEAYAICSEAKPMGVVQQFKHFPVSVSAGQNDISQIPVGTALIAGIHMAKSDVTHCTLKINNQIDMVDRVSKVATDELQETYGRLAQSGLMWFDFVMEGDWRQAIVGQGITDMRLRPEVTTAGTLEIDVEYYASLGSV